MLCGNSLAGQKRADTSQSGIINWAKIEEEEGGTRRRRKKRSWDTKKKKRVTQVSVEINRSLRKKEIKKDIGKRWREREKRIECFFGIVSQLMPINVNEVELCAVR